MTVQVIFQEFETAIRERFQMAISQYILEPLLCLVCRVPTCMR